MEIRGLGFAINVFFFFWEIYNHCVLHLSCSMIVFICISDVEATGKLFAVMRQVVKGA